MNCKTCLKANPIPACMEEDGTYILTGVTFPANPNETIAVEIIDTATGRNISGFLDSDGSGVTTGISLGDVVPLMDHTYEMRFYAESGAQVTATLQGEEGCCIEFTSREGEADGDVPLSLETCSVE